MTESLHKDPRFREIPRERVSERVAQELMSLIAAGTLVPGERLPGERNLAEMMNVSRVSVRAALQELKAQGFIVAVQGGGTRVSTGPKVSDSPLMRLVRADTRNYHDLAELRAHIETWAARRAAERASDEQIAAIAEACERMADPLTSPQDKNAQDYAFHLAIAKASQSSVYVHLFDMMGEILERTIEFTRSTLCPSQEETGKFLAEHRRIVNAIRSRDPEAAEAAMARHLQHVVSSYDAVKAPDTPSAAGESTAEIPAAPPPAARTG
jgi:DNA-binding FadR family transcriptional regulator